MLIEKYRPGTFLERGVAVPFTTPMLIGSRARPGEREGLELVVPNPSGGRGVYLFDWSGIAQFCQPSLYDLALTERVAAMRSVTPASIRRAAEMVAAGGLAGREVADAATWALRHEQQSGLLANFTLLIGLMQQIEAAKPGQIPLECENPAQLQQRARHAIAIFAPKIGMDGDQVANELEELADIFVRVGVGAAANQAHLPRLLAKLKRFRGELSAWAATTNSPVGDVARQIAAQAASTIETAEPMIAAAQARTNDVVQLLRDNFSAPIKLAGEIARPDWLLDGWEFVCLRWHAAADEDRETVIEELAALLPAIPDEAEKWGLGALVEFDRSWLRKVQSGHDWRTGILAFQAIARGEETLRLAYAGDAI